MGLKRLVGVPRLAALAGSVRSAGHPTAFPGHPAERDDRQLPGPGASGLLIDWNAIRLPTGITAPR